MFDLEFAASIMPAMMRGLWVTVIATIGGFLLALAVGTVIEAGRRSPLRALRLFCRGYVAFMRCTPLLVQLYFVFYVLPAYGIRFGALTTGIICLGMHVGAYIAEAYRAGIAAVPRASRSSRRMVSGLVMSWSCLCWSAGGIGARYLSPRPSECCDAAQHKHQKEPVRERL